MFLVQDAPKIVENGIDGVQIPASLFRIGDDTWAPCGDGVKYVKAKISSPT